MSIFSVFIGLESEDGPETGSSRGARGNRSSLSCSAIDAGKFPSLGLRFLCVMGDDGIFLVCQCVVAPGVRNEHPRVCLS